MFERLVVPLDGSELAERALPYAVRLAKVGHGRIVLHREAPMPASYEIIEARQFQTDTRAEVERYLASVADKIGPIVQVDIVPSLGKAPADGILHTVTEQSADAIVMATHGRSGLPHLLYGSVAEAILAASPVPVLLVHARPGENVAAPFDPVAARLMVPLDGSSFSESALSAAVDFLGLAGELVLTRVVDRQEESLTSEAREYLEGVAQRLRETYPGIHVSTEVRHGEPVGSLTLAAIERGADLVVMATHGRTGVRRSIMGSVAGGVLRTGGTPLLLIGPANAPPSRKPASTTRA